MRRRGSINYVSLLFLLGLIFLSWALYEGVPAYYSKAQSDTELRGILVSNWRKSDEEVREKVQQHFSSKERFEFNMENFDFIRDEENPRKLSSQFYYQYVIPVPLTEKKIRIPFEVQIALDMTLQNSLR